MKKCISTLLALAMVLSLAACGGGGDKSGGSQTQAPSGGSSGTTQPSGGGTSAAVPDYSKYQVTEPVTIEFWHNYSNAKRAAFLEDVADSFNKSQDLITVNVNYIGGYPAIAEQVAGALSAGTGLPAISTINVPRVLNFAGSEIIEPLDEYFAALDVDMSDYFEGILDGVSAPDGHIYALPFGISGGVCIYNKDVLDQIGKPFPETWDDFKVWCKEVHELTGKTAFAFPYDFNYMNTFFLNVTGVDPLGDGTVSALDDPRIISFVKDVKELIDAGYCSWVGVKINDATDDMQAAFNLGELIAYTNTSTDVLGVTDSVEFNVDTAIGVSGTGAPPRTTTSGASLVIYSDNDQQVKSAAFQFATYLTNTENVSQWVIDTCMFPTRKSVVEGGALNSLYQNYPGVKNIFDHAGELVGKNKSTAMQSCMETVVTVMGDYLMGNVSDFDTAWANLKTEVDRMLADT